MSAAAAVVPGPTAHVRRARRARQVRVGVVLALLVAVACGVSLCLGEAAVAPLDVLRALVGQADVLTRFVIFDLRLPRLETGLLVGACLGVSGGLLQSVVRNPLASPDIVGITQAASAAGVIGIVGFSLGGLALSGLVLVGALAAALLVYALAWRAGLSGYRFVLVGIGVAAVASAIVSYVLTRSAVTDVREALVWLTGSLNGAGGDRLSVLAVAALVLLPLAWVQGPRLAQLELGDDTAAALGVGVERTRGLAVLTAVALAAVAVAAAGPVTFVALVSAPIARRLVASGAPALVCSALVGALVVVVADGVAQFAVPGTIYPVGVVTGIVGAPYLLWLLTRTNRAGRGG
ncbi:iron chelate uptake ABC transporter family permease subunit [Luteimicrobium xylanilyticum]|uniref:Achromobactin transport system permease protein CbrC n=1 Tax=Luteimicrobium xylanilyticum TaxID=1133546 RepID=A0A5P9QBF1_9MICO|nr:iron chelate uptake ABC transporter family permease subunit [Luteimicrobium xylanilyticum]QFU98754.1 Achromobactin transport system permease protein CbrC [Luteimicrobium xylanilyticum]